MITNKKISDKKMNLLILGAGSHGHAVYDTAEALGIFQKIRFLDDFVTGDNIIGNCSDYLDFTDEYPAAFVAIGNNEIRRDYATKLKNANYICPRLIHPDTTVSRGAVIGQGSIIMAQATINPSTIGDFCIIASNALVSYDAKVGNFCHLDCGSMVMKNAAVDDMSVVESGEIVKAGRNLL